MTLASGQINKQNIEDIYPLSPMQQGMLFHSLYAPDSGIYFQQTVCTLRGNLEVLAFEQAWQKIVEKYSIFRTAFIWESLNKPVQVVYKKVTVTVESYDWQGLSNQEQQQQLKFFLESDQQKSLQLSQPPLMRLHLIQLNKNIYQFVFSSHHLLLDAWSLPLVFNDLLNFYEAISQGETIRYQSTPSYRNYIAWLQQQDQELAEKFWKQKLQGFTAATPLTVDKPLSKVENSNISYGEQQIQLTLSATEALQSFARQHRLTLSNLIQATWGLLLSRYSQENDVVFGVTVSGRPPSMIGVESMVGLFLNTLPMRVQVSAETQVLDLLKDLQAQQIECEQYSYSSLADIQGWSDIPRRTSLFESILVFESNTLKTGLKSNHESLELDNIRGFERTNYPLTVVAVPRQQMLVRISYDTNRFNEGTITRLLGHFQTLLTEIVANPQQNIYQLPILTEVEKQELLIDWNNRQTDYHQDKCIHQLFEEQVKSNPDGVAITYENKSLTYQELNNRANQLAHYLQKLSVTPDTLVGICVERSLEMIVGILGILKAGGAYVPLDPEYPQERLSFMLEDSQVKILLTQQKIVDSIPQNKITKSIDKLTDKLIDELTKKSTDELKDKLTDELKDKLTDESTDKLTDKLTDELTDKLTDESTDKLTDKLTDESTDKLTDESTDKLTDESTDKSTDKMLIPLLICLDTEWEKIAQESILNPESAVKPDNLTYIIYTSGSTGKPKGVLVNHSNVVRLFAATDSWYHFKSQDVWTLFHSYAFDFSVWEMWGALLYGGRLVIVPYLITRSPESFYELLCQEKVTILNQTPSAFRQLIQVEQTRGNSQEVEGKINDLMLRLVIFGGEALEINSLQPWFEGHGDKMPQLVNMYGITETTVHVTYRPLSIADLQSTASIIGRQIPDLQIYLLDQHLQPLPIGVPGEMYVGGAGVTRCYLNRPELTTERFIPNPFEESEGSKLYKTGDLARYLPNGELQYLGRIDNQVKIRGFRIELGEIESILTQYSPIWENVVIVREDSPGDKRLVAYVVPQPDKTLTITEIRQFLKDKLPEYMVPNAFVILEALPLTQNGKIDRRVLPVPEISHELSDKYVAPRTPIEEMLANTWSEVLKVEKVGINDNFFEMGGHSLLATQLVARIRDRFKVELPLRELFNTAKLAELAVVIEQLKQQKSTSSVSPILPRKRK